MLSEAFQLVENVPKRTNHGGEKSRAGNKDSQNVQDKNGNQSKSSAKTKYRHHCASLTRVNTEATITGSRIVAFQSIRRRNKFKNSMLLRKK